MTYYFYSYVWRIEQRDWTYANTVTCEHPVEEVIRRQRRENKTDIVMRKKIILINFRMISREQYDLFRDFHRIDTKLHDGI